MILKFQSDSRISQYCLGRLISGVALIRIWFGTLGADVRKEDQENIKSPP